MSLQNEIEIYSSDPNFPLDEDEDGLPLPFLEHTAKHDCEEDKMNGGGVAIFPDQHMTKNATVTLPFSDFIKPSLGINDDSEPGYDEYKDIEIIVVTGCVLYKIPNDTVFRRSTFYFELSPSSIAEDFDLNEKKRTWSRGELKIKQSSSFHLAN